LMCCTTSAWKFSTVSRIDVTNEPRAFPRLVPALTDSETVKARSSRAGSSMASFGVSRSSASVRTAPLPRWRTAIASMQTWPLLSRSWRSSQFSRVVARPVSGASTVSGSGWLASRQ
jgi:hypothetical protein